LSLTSIKGLETTRALHDLQDTDEVLRTATHQSKYGRVYVYIYIHTPRSVHQLVSWKARVPLLLVIDQRRAQPSTGSHASTG